MRRCCCAGASARRQASTPGCEGLPPTTCYACLMCTVLLPPLLRLQMHQEDLRYVRRCLEAFAGKESYRWALDEMRAVEGDGGGLDAILEEEGEEEGEEDAKLKLDELDSEAADAADGAPLLGSALRKETPHVLKRGGLALGVRQLTRRHFSKRVLQACRTKIIRDPACNEVVLPWWLPPERVPPEVTGALPLLLLR